jgi:hypothetical protein
MSYKDKVIELLESRGCDSLYIECEKYHCRIAQEKLYHVTYLPPEGKRIKVLAKSLYAVKAWRKAYEKLTA